MFRAKSLSKLLPRLKNGAIVALFLTTQLAVPLGATGLFTAHAAATPQCVTDTAGANDVPGQKDLTKLCVDTSASTTVQTTWNWDELGTTGANTLDACNLFDTDDDGNANYAVCVTTQDTPATFQTLTTYSCGDASVDRCTSPNTPVSSVGTSCTVTQDPTGDPFPTGSSSPKDTQGTCTVQLSTVGGSSAQLIDVCSYPSSQPNSDPSDCVVAIPGEAKLTVVKSVVPNTDTGRFDLQIDGTTYATNVGDAGTTGVHIVTAANNNHTHTVLEQANSTTNPTSLSNYSTSVVCKDQHGTGTTLSSGTPSTTPTRQLSVTVAADSDVVCTFTNTRATGTITVTKVVNNQHGGTANPSQFPLFVGSTSVTSGATNTYTANQSYTVSETANAVSGYTQTGATCVDASNQTSLTTTFTLAANQNVNCTITNSDTAPTLTLVKNVSNTHGGNATAANFQGKINGTNVTWGTANTESAGMYTLSEAALAGGEGYSASAWSCVGGTQNGNQITLALGQNVTCTITNSDIAPTLSLTKIVSGGTAQTTDWTLSATPTSGTTLSGAGGFSSQAAQSNIVYTLSESTGPTGYSASNWSCTGGSLSGGNKLTLAPGATASCSITNTRDTGSLTINKIISPNTDNGLFNLIMTGPTNFTANNQGNGGTTGAQTVGTGSYTVSETAGTSTSLSDYSSVYSCYNGATKVSDGSGTTSASFTVNKGDNIACTFTNTHYGSISGTKYEVNANGSHVAVIGGVQICIDANNNNVCDQNESSTLTANDGTFSFSHLLAGGYNLIETVKDGWTQIFGGGNVTLTDGQNSTGNDFGNFQNGSISGVKFNDHNGNAAEDSGDENLSGWTINLEDSQNNILHTQDTSASGYSFTNLAPGTYKVCEVGQTGWTQTLPGNNGCYTIVIDQSGETNTADFGNQGHGTLTVSKNLDDGFGNITNNVSGWTWNYNGTLKSDSNVTASTSNAVTVPAGTYTVTENNQTNYHFGGLSCSAGDITNASASVTVTPGGSVSCTYTNVRDTGSLVLKKHVVNDNGGTAAAADFSLHVKQSGTDVIGSPAAGSESGTSYNLTTGSYTVSENTPPTGYTQTSIVCDGQPTATVSVTSGQSKTCVITNDDVAPKLTLVKYVTNDNGGTAQTTDFTLSATPKDDQFATLSGAGGATGTVQANLGYDLSETNLSGYAPSSWFCGVGANLSGTTITLAPGADVTCSITNNDVAPVITVTKTVVNDNGGTLQVSDFPLFVGTLQVTSGVQTSINAGSYTVSETGNINYQASAWSGDCNALGNITLVVGGVYSCSITNNDIAPKLTVIKQVVNTNTNLTKTADDFTMKVTGTNVSNGSFPGSTSGTNVTLNAGPYSVSETADSDYTASYSADCSGSIDIGQTKTCTVTNTAILKPAIHVEKSGPDTAYEGDQVTYNFAVTNTGNTPLSIAEVNDDVAGDGTYVSGDTNSNGTLDLDETWLYSADYTIPADSSDITNTVTVCGDDANETQVCDTDHHTTHVYHPMISVTKHVYTSKDTDSGTFNLNIDGTPKATGGDNTTTGDVLVTPGTHTVSETGANGTDLSDYDSNVSCYIGEQYIGTQTDTTLHNVTVTGDQQAHCDIYNVRHAHLTIVKDAQPNSAQPFSFTLDKFNPCQQVTVETLTNVAQTDSQCDSYSSVDNFDLVDNTDPALATKTESLSAGNLWLEQETSQYRLTEAVTAGWHLTGLTCTGTDAQADGASIDLTLEAGQDVTCTYTNAQDVGEVLGVSTVAPTELVNTGQSIWVNLVIAVTALSVVAGLALATRKQHQN